MLLLLRMVARALVKINSKRQWLVNGRTLVRTVNFSFAVSPFLPINRLVRVKRKQ